MKNKHLKIVIKWDDLNFQDFIYIELLIPGIFKKNAT